MGNIKTVELAPPVLSKATLLKTLYCTRPVRDGCFNISTEILSQKESSKLLTHCYGHGGSGWTTLFGSVEKAIKHFENARDRNGNFSMPIRVIGSGCMGLVSAIELARKGYPVKGIYTKTLYDTPSWRAGGYFALVSVKTSVDEEKNLIDLGISTFQTIQKIERGEHPYLTPHTVRFLPFYSSKETICGVESLEERGLVPRREEVILDFGDKVRHPHYYKYSTYFMDPVRMMQELLLEVERLKIPIEVQKIASFYDVEEEIIFNCTGLGARDLVNDNRVIPVRGHLILLNDGAGAGHMDYMIYTKFRPEKQEEGFIYMFPKTHSISHESRQSEPCRSVLGGTFIPDTDKLSSDELAALDKREFQKMLDRHSLFFTGRPFR